MSRTGNPSSTPFSVNGVLTHPTFYGHVNGYAFSNGSYSFTKIVISQDYIGANSVFTFWMDMGFGSPGGVQASQGIMQVSGSATFIADLSLAGNYSGAVVKGVSPTVMYSYANTPPADRINGLTDHVNNISHLKYTHSNGSNVTRYYKLGFLILAQGGRQARKKKKKH